MRRRVVVICCLLSATSATAEPTVLTGDTLKAAVTGAVLEVETPVGIKVPLRYFEDGRVTGEARGLAYILGAESDTGKWWVSSSEDRLCHKWSKWFDGVLQCIRISRQGSRIFWRRDDGETGTAIISTPPTPPRVIVSAPKAPEPPPEPARREIREPSVAYSASMAGLAILAPRANELPVTGPLDKEPAPSSEPVLAPVMAEPVIAEPDIAKPDRPVDTKPAEARAVEPAAKAIRPAQPKQEAAAIQRAPVNANRPGPTFRVAGVASHDVLNVRDGPSADYRATGAILPDAVGVHIVGRCQAEWCPISHRGITGWVNSLYLLEETTVRRPGIGMEYRR